MVANTLIMGVVNVTPDSFSDGGCHYHPEKAYEKSLELVDAGCDIVDLGAESSRPGALPVPAKLEWERLEPVLRKIADNPINAKISVDTRHAENMRKLLNFPVEIINDIQGGCDDATLSLLASENRTYLAMHKSGTPENMQEIPLSAGQALIDVESFYQKTHNRLINLGFSEDRIWLDPGIGFGKTDAANLQLIKQAQNLSSRYNLAVGVSRKSFIGRLLGIDNPLERDRASKMLELGLMFHHVSVIRTHEVGSLSLMRGLLAPCEREN